VAATMPELGDAELEVLKALWDGGPGPVRQVLAHLHDRKRRVAYTTVLTVLSRLEQKGYVASDKSGLAYVYRAKVSRQRVAATRVKAMIDQLYDGAAGQLALQLVKGEKLTPEEIVELQKLIERLDPEAR
jgi:BlaI family transcriptional regulator, penicillinase repressor